MSKCGRLELFKETLDKWDSCFSCLPLPAFTYGILDFPSLYTRMNKNAGPLVGKGPSVSILFFHEQSHMVLRT